MSLQLYLKTNWPTNQFSGRQSGALYRRKRLGHVNSIGCRCWYTTYEITGLYMTYQTVHYLSGSVRPNRDPPTIPFALPRPIKATATPPKAHAALEWCVLHLQETLEKTFTSNQIAKKKKSYHGQPVWFSGIEAHQRNAGIGIKGPTMFPSSPVEVRTGSQLRIVGCCRFNLN